jgi:hypothetical protein
MYPFIEAENVNTTGNVKRACDLLEVSRAAYYAHRASVPSPRAVEDAALLEAITTVWDWPRPVGVRVSGSPG